MPCRSDAYLLVALNKVTVLDNSSYSPQSILPRKSILLFMILALGDTNNALKSKMTAISIDNLFGLKMLVVSLIRVDFGPLGFNPPHTHRMAIESSVSLSSKTSSTSIS
ncbi:unnamed protein product [Spirodela intermedia]|uniref:Cupin type-1 domain-containing protein n=1 Tax=Spirodela intermedia TaxID=51605 RepID=A0ABN7E9D5_SPIIN|nr:unnamed protein product [Spirodela intermedia]